MILTERQAKRELLRLGLEERRRVIERAAEAFGEYRDIAAWQARVYSQDADREEVTPGVLWCRCWLRFWQFFERRHEANIEWVRSLEAAIEQGGRR